MKYQWSEFMVQMSVFSGSNSVMFYQRKDWKNCETAGRRRIRKTWKWWCNISHFIASVSFFFRVWSEEVLRTFFGRSWKINKESFALNNKSIKSYENNVMVHCSAISSTDNSFFLWEVERFFFLGHTKHLTCEYAFLHIFFCFLLLFRSD